MIIYKPGQNEPARLSEAHDPDAKKIYKIAYGASDWASATAHICDESVVMPSTFNGFYYEAMSGGISGASEPTWPTAAGETVVDGSVTWRAICWDLFLDEGETITASTWSSDVAITMDTEALASPLTSVRVTAVPSGVLEFTLTNHVTKSNDEEDDRSMLIQVLEL